MSLISPTIRHKSRQINQSRCRLFARPRQQIDRGGAAISAPRDVGASARYALG